MITLRIKEETGMIIASVEGIRFGYPRASNFSLLQNVHDLLISDLSSAFFDAFGRTPAYDNQVIVEIEHNDNTYVWDWYLSRACFCKGQLSEKAFLTATIKS